MSFGVGDAIKKYKEEHGKEPEELVFEKHSEQGIQLAILYREEAPFTKTLSTGLRITVK